MDISKRLKEHNQKILRLNKEINSLLNEQTPPTPPPVDTGISDEDFDKIKRVTDKLISLATQTSATDLSTTKKQDSKIKSIWLTHEEIKLGRNKKIDPKVGVVYKVADVLSSSGKTIIILNNDSSRIIDSAAHPDYVELIIEVPSNNIENYLNQKFTAKIKMKNITTGVETDLPSVSMSFNKIS